MPGKAEHPPSRARKRKSPTEGTTEARVAHIAELMRTLKFKRGKTAKELSKAWDLGIDRVHELTAAASKRVRAEVMNPDRVSADVGTALQITLADEMAKGRRKNGRVIADLARTWMQISGAAAPQEIKVTASAAATPAAAKKAMEEAFGRFTEGGDDASSAGTLPDVSGSEGGATQS
jgi:hypothetical protein